MRLFESTYYRSLSKSCTIQLQPLAGWIYFYTFVPETNIYMYMDKKRAKRIIQLIIAILSVIASFISGQATAQNGQIDLFNKFQTSKNQ